MGNEVRFAILSIRGKYANNVQSKTEMMTRYKKKSCRKKFIRKPPFSPT
jgi:hypothetical protein